MLETVYGHKDIACMCVFEWLKRFRKGHKNHIHDPQYGWPSTAWNPTAVMEVHNLVARDNQMVLKLITNRLCIKWERICQILHDDLGTRKTCIKSV
jgi:hypothetical protein